MNNVLEDLLLIRENSNKTFTEIFRQLCLFIYFSVCSFVLLFIFSIDCFFLSERFIFCFSYFFIKYIYFVLFTYPINMSINLFFPLVLRRFYFFFEQRKLLFLQTSIRTNFFENYIFLKLHFVICPKQAHLIKQLSKYSSSLFNSVAISKSIFAYSLPINSHNPTIQAQIQSPIHPIKHTINHP